MGTFSKDQEMDSWKFAHKFVLILPKMCKNYF